MEGEPQVTAGQFSGNAGTLRLHLNEVYRTPSNNRGSFGLFNSVQCKIDAFPIQASGKSGRDEAGGARHDATQR
jgi:hypothetical protein